MFVLAEPNVVVTEKSCGVHLAKCVAYILKHGASYLIVSSASPKESQLSS